jgi:hypothetical protein
MRLNNQGEDLYALYLLSTRLHGIEIRFNAFGDLSLVDLTYDTFQAPKFMAGYLT